MPLDEYPAFQDYSWEDSSLGGRANGDIGEEQAVLAATG